MDIVDIMKTKVNFHALTPVTTDAIIDGEEKLGIQFSAEYKAYLSKLGLASFVGHELTGICSFPRLNVVDVTIKMRSLYPEALSDWYVIEQTNMDGIVIWQSTTGEIYQTFPNAKPCKIADSLTDYISKCE